MDDRPERHVHHGADGHQQRHARRDHRCRCQHHQLELRHVQRPESERDGGSPVHRHGDDAAVCRQSQYRQSRPVELPEQHDRHLVVRDGDQHHNQGAQRHDPEVDRASEPRHQLRRRRHPRQLRRCRGQLRCWRPDQLPAGADEHGSLARIQRAHRRQPRPSRGGLQFGVHTANRHRPCRHAGHAKWKPVRRDRERRPHDRNHSRQYQWRRRRQRGRPRQLSMHHRRGCAFVARQHIGHRQHGAPQVLLGRSGADHQCALQLRGKPGVTGSQRAQGARHRARYPVNLQGHHRVEPAADIAAHGRDRQYQ